MRRNNKGFTLTEVLIAAAILTVAITPMVANFVQSSKMNQRAKKNMEATYMAQDIMEGVTSYGAEDIIKMFESETDLVGKVLPNTVATYASHGDYNPASTATYTIARNAHDVPNANAVGNRQYAKKVVSGNTTDVKKSSDGNYYFYVKDVERGKNKYDVKLTLSTSQTAKYVNSSKGGLKELVTKSSSAKINAQDMPYILNIESPYDASLKTTIDDLDTRGVISDMVSHSTKPSKFSETYIANINGINVSRPLWEKSVTRKTTIHIEADKKVNISFDYGIISGDRTTFGYDSSVITKESGNINELFPEALPRSIYLFVEGMPSAAVSYDYDTFEVKNDSGEAVNVYIIRTISASSDFSDPTKMQTNSQISGVLTTTTDVLYNTNYKSSIAVTDSAAKTKVITNLRYNLSKLYDTTKSADEQDGFSATRCTFTYNGTSVPISSTNMLNGYAIEKQDYIYTAFLEIYDSNTGKQLTVIDGGLNY